MAHTLSPSEQLAHCTVRIEVETASGRGTGTGFFFQFVETDEQHVPVIVTNKHVVAGALKGKFHVTITGPDGNPDYVAHEVYELDNFQQRWVPHPDPDVDLCAMPIGPLVSAAKQQRKQLFYVLIDKSLIPTEDELAGMTAMEDVTMVGYPNGIWDQKHNMPVLRRGITATHPRLDWNGKPEFLIDAACFPGSSGSPVFLFNMGSYPVKGGGIVLGSRVKLLGVLYAGPQHTVAGEIKIVPVPTVDKAVAVSSIPNNLGMIIKARKLSELDAAVAALMRKPAFTWSAGAGPYSIN
jgi:hypothetical protein